MAFPAPRAASVTPTSHRTSDRPAKSIASEAAPDASTPCSSAAAQRATGTGRGFFRVERPDQLWHLDMTSVWVAEHGWSYLNAAIDCCTREIVGWALDVRCRAPEATAVIDRAALERGIGPGQLTLGTDN